MTTIKRKHTAQFKTQVVLELLKEEKTLSQICSQFAIHPTQARRWKQKALEGLAVIFSDSIKNELIGKDELIQRLYTQIGQQKVELDWLKKRWACQHKSVKENLSLIDKNHRELPLTKQAELLGISRNSLYYQTRPISPLTIKIMNQIDEIYTSCPFYGSRKITAQLKRDGYPVNRKRIRRLMDIMGIEAIYPKKYLSLPDKYHQVYPYLLKGLIINRPNQVWGIDITYIRLVNGWVYLAAILDLFSRFVLAWDLSLSLEKELVINIANKAFLINLPDILNSDQGSQMTAKEYLELVESKGIKVSMDSQGRVFDNIFNERLWRAVKYEEVYLKEYYSSKEAEQNLSNYFNFYNFKRLHQSLNYQTPAEVYFRKIKN